jgi:hypothetical protein
MQLAMREQHSTARQYLQACQAHGLPMDRQELQLPDWTALTWSTEVGTTRAARIRLISAAHHDILRHYEQSDTSMSAWAQQLMGRWWQQEAWWGDDGSSGEQRSDLEVAHDELQAARRAHLQCVHARDVAAATALEWRTAQEKVLRRQRMMQRYTADETLLT